ncbi:cysteine--tRNA ligase [Alteribacillus sp. HJP-4]|uniref:cysteine--tRNA ligase n=1 Tax=Alteribacillus sp. HJP-4 TaxID=2775394 RepID=UPI0035CD3132
MAITLYNTMSRKKEAFVPLEKGKVKMYVCGPTVYNYIHIGNARPAVVFDMVRKYLEYRGYEVEFVTNFTDVDDKIIKAAKELKEKVPVLAERFIAAYHEDTSALGVKKADLHPRVTETMPDIIAFIKALIEKGFAYEADGDVYFQTRSFSGYGKLSSQSIEDLQMGARIEIGEKKKDPLDFALWKAAKEDEISWESPWGAGRPGWHIECSAMVKKYLGETIDIHAGGQDLAFPHHENEVAQSEALNQKQMAKYWMHNGYIQIDNEKMSKSLGNFVLVQDIIKQYRPEVVRFFMLQSHYRSPLNFSAELLTSAQNSLERIQTTAANLKHRLKMSADFGEKKFWLEQAKNRKQQFIQAMDDDFNTANGISTLFDLVKDANMYLQEQQTSKEVLEAMLEVIRDIGSLMDIPVEPVEEILDEDIEQLIAERIKARKDKNFARADEIRDTLKEQGIILEDTPQGTRWKREQKI